MARREHVEQVFAHLAQAYPDADCELEYGSPFQLLIATILSAQCTDVQVNKLTRPLFRQYPTVEQMATLSLAELEEAIRGCGLYRNKAKNILATCSILLEEYGGQVPHTLDELIKLPGVGRKTANVVLANAYGVPAFAVDTHVLRVSQRLGLATAKTPDGAEGEITSLLPPELWKDAHHQLIWHGRRICYARNPSCQTCPLTAVCPSSLIRKGDDNK